MMSKIIALKPAVSMGLGTVLGCVLAINSPPGQANAIHDGDGPETTSSSPGETLQVDGGIDYENAKPMPLPSVPDPSNPEAVSAPTTGPAQDTPESSPGNTGSGEENPQVLVPPKPLQSTDKVKPD